jgi:hypothetical protein
MIQTVLTWYGIPSTGEAKTAPDNGHRGNLRLSPVVLRDTKGMREHVSLIRILRSPRSSVLFGASKYAVSRLLVCILLCLFVVKFALRKSGHEQRDSPSRFENERIGCTAYKSSQD